jgi:DNA-binding MarR family transcriptional regulator
LSLCAQRRIEEYPTNDSELQLLETIYSVQDETEPPSQRKLAGQAGLSLGMTNVLLKRFAERGWVKLSHLSSRSLRYILTPEGMEEIMLRSLAYFSRAAKSASLYRAKIETFVRSLPGQGMTTLVLEGPAELDFLFEYACERHGIEFVKNPRARRREILALQESALFVLSRLSESCEESPSRSICLAEIIFPCTSA